MIRISMIQVSIGLSYWISFRTWWQFCKWEGPTADSGHGPSEGSHFQDRDLPKWRIASSRMVVCFPREEIAF